MSNELSLKGSGVSKNHKRFPETITHRIFETNFSFDMKYCTTVKVQFLFSRFSTSVNKTFILAGTLGIRLSFYDI